MNRYYGGETVPGGVYLNISTLEFTQVHDGAPVLPGSRANKYIKAPALLAAVAGPVAGLAFVLFLPFVGLAGMVTFLAYKLVRLAKSLGGKVFRTPANLEAKPYPAQPGNGPAPADDAELTDRQRGDH